MAEPSIAVVILDTLRKDVFSRYFEWVPGVRFENAYSTSHWTVPAHASLLTGQYASEVGVHGKSRDFDYSGETIVETINNYGYSTRIWTANMQIHAWNGWDRGFQEVLGPNELRPGAEESVSWQYFNNSVNSEGINKYAKAIYHAITASESTSASLREGYRQFRDGSGERGAEQILKRLRGTIFGDKEFLLLNLMEAHTPHYPANPFRSVDEVVDFKIGDAFGGLIENPDRNRRVYDDSSAYLSSIYKDIFEELVKNFNIIITLSDHGELLGEYDMWNHGYGIYPQLVHIPFVVWCDDKKAVLGNKPRKDVVSILDIPKTLSEAIGIEYQCRGKDIMTDTDSTERLVEFHGFLPWHRKQFEEKGVPDIYDTYDEELNGIVRENGKYIFETHEKGFLCPKGTSTAEDKARLETCVSELSKRSVSTERKELSPEIMEQLEELGYA